VNTDRTMPSVGIQLPTVDGFRRGYRDIRPTVRAAETVGLDSVWVGDHLIANAPIVESIVAATTAAAVSDRLRIGFAVMLAALRHPVWIGKQISSLQAVSGGRVELGIGVGGEISGEWEAAGVPIGERGRRTDTVLRALPDLVTGREATLGAPWDTTVPPMEPFGPMPALWIGGRSDVALRRAVTHCGGWMALWSDEERLRRAHARMSELAAEISAPVPEMGVQVLVHPSNDGADGESDIASFMEQVYRIPFARLSRYAVAGGHDAIIERLTSLVNAGARTIVLIPAVREYEPYMDDLGALAEGVRSRVVTRAGVNS
jgi:alkanesulfonate monooxygenase SsuD/methylene tetrahydromethanopterin reductase-like flavin-dependent oxidoreductase (luciferase family)